MASRALFLLAMVGVVACSEGSAKPVGPAPSAAVAEPGTPKQDFGNVMVSVARRFELAGRAVVANRYELAEFEASELGEVFEDDVPNADLPKEGPTAHIPAMAKAFLQTNVPELTKAAAAKDRTAFAAAFRNAATACNACHTASAKPFVQIPLEIGKAVPDLEPLPAPSAR